MKFDALYKNVFITEQDEVALPEDDYLSPVTDEMPTDEPSSKSEDGGMPEPDNYDVEPAPIQQSVGDSGTVKNYIMKLDEFADTLNGVDTDSLQQMVTDMDRVGSLFQGISRETSTKIIKLAEQARELSEVLKGFIINSAKRQRDIAAGQG